MGVGLFRISLPRESFGLGDEVQNRSSSVVPQHVRAYDFFEPADPYRVFVERYVCCPQSFIGPGTKRVKREVKLDPAGFAGTTTSSIALERACVIVHCIHKENQDHFLSFSITHSRTLILLFRSESGKHVLHRTLRSQIPRPRRPDRKRLPSHHRLLHQATRHDAREVLFKRR